MADLKTNLLGFAMNSPIIGASGTVGYGVEYEELADFTKIGGISGKGLTLHGQYGNKGERLWETPSGLINSIGLQNPGVQHFIDVELNEMLELKQKYGTVAIANLGGHSEEEYVEGAALLSDSAVDIVELNISCPNVKVGGMAYGVKAEAAGAVVRMVRDACIKTSFNLPFTFHYCSHSYISFLSESLCGSVFYVIIIPKQGNFGM